MMPFRWAEQTVPGFGSGREREHDTSSQINRLAAEHRPALVIGAVLKRLDNPGKRMSPRQHVR